MKRFGAIVMLVLLLPAGLEELQRLLGGESDGFIFSLTVNISAESEEIYERPDVYAVEQHMNENGLPLALELQGLRKRFGTTLAVNDLNLGIPQGQLYALLGPNGAGKTTTLRMVAGLLEPDKGDALIMGHSVSNEPLEAKRLLAYLPDDPMLYGKLTPLEYLEFVAGLWGMPADAAAERARDLLTWFSLWGQRRDYTETFSRGMKQKLALAGALIHEPRVMILDEPLTGLDAAAAKDVKDMLSDYVTSGNTVVLTTHIMEVAERLAERIGIIAGGSLQAEGSLDELRARSGGAGTLEDVFLEVVRVEKT